MAARCRSSTATGFRPDLGEAERIEREGLGLLVGHDLNEQSPAREVAALNAVEEVALVRLPVLAHQGLRLGVGSGTNANSDLNPAR